MRSGSRWSHCSPNDQSTPWGAITHASLTEIGRTLGCVGDVQWARFEQKREAIALELQRLKSTWVSPRMLADAEALRVIGKVIEREYSLADLLRRPDVSYDRLMTLTGLEGQGLAALGALQEDQTELKEQVEIQLKYAGYIERQAKEVTRHAYFEHLILPPQFDYLEVNGLSIEVRQKLNAQRPETLGQASRISGITPAAMSLLLVHLKKRGYNQFATVTTEPQPKA